MSSLLLKNGTIVNEMTTYKGGVFIDGEVIADVYDYSSNDASEKEHMYSLMADEVMDISGLYVSPGIIDTHVHFREPGATYKATIATESAAAALGGVTSYMDMPNNVPAISNMALLEDKFLCASHNSVVNYSFYLGATNGNIDEVMKIDPASVCGVKAFLGSSTGNMLLDDPMSIDHLFLKSPVPVVAHCEDNVIIEQNLKKAREQFGDHIPFSKHPDIRSRESCIKATDMAVRFALKNNTRLHIAHISTKEEVEMLKIARMKSLLITGEACVGYLFYDDRAYSEYGSMIKCNPSIKTYGDKNAIRRGLRKGVISTIATDHAPHLLSEKQMPYTKSPSGTPYVQFGFLMMLELVHKHTFTLEMVVDKMSHSPARCFNVRKRGFIRPGYYADFVIFDYNMKSMPKIAYKCAWSPVNKFSSSILHTIVNGEFVVRNGELTDNHSGKKLSFDR